jgi:hypothetical protein
MNECWILYSNPTQKFSSEPYTNIYNEEGEEILNTNATYYILNGIII